MEKEKIELNYVDRQRSEEGRYQEIGGGRLDRRKPTSATRLGNFWKIWETKISYKNNPINWPFWGYCEKWHLPIEIIVAILGTFYKNWAYSLLKHQVTLKPTLLWNRLDKQETGKARMGDRPREWAWLWSFKSVIALNAFWCIKLIEANFTLIFSEHLTRLNHESKIL